MQSTSIEEIQKVALASVLKRFKILNKINTTLNQKPLPIPPAFSSPLRRCASSCAHFYSPRKRSELHWPASFHFHRSVLPAIFWRSCSASFGSSWPCCPALGRHFWAQLEREEMRWRPWPQRGHFRLPWEQRKSACADCWGTCFPNRPAGTGRCGSWICCATVRTRGRLKRWGNSVNYHFF